MNQELRERLSRFAPVLESLPEREDSSVCYSILADAVYWSDELPPRDAIPGGTDDLRFILRYRTSMILDAPDACCLQYWEVAKHLFPGWIGFQPKRCTPSRELQATYRALRAKAEVDFDA